MRSLLFLICSSLIISLTSYGQNTNPHATAIAFDTISRWEQLKTRAKSEGKYIFIDFYTTWCLPCKLMDDHVFSRREVGDFVNNRYISVRVKGDKGESDGQYITSWYRDAENLKKELAVTAYPTYVFLSPDGRPVYKTVGFSPVNEFLQHARNALDTTFQYQYKVEQFKRLAVFDAALTLKLARTGKELGQNESAHEVANKFINIVTKKDLNSIDVLWLIYEFTESTNDRGFYLLRKYIDKLAELDLRLSKPYLQRKIEEIIKKKEVIPFVATNYGTTNWKAIERNLAKYGSVGAIILKREKTLAAAQKMRENKIFENYIEPYLDSGMTDCKSIISRIKALKVGFGEEYLIGATGFYYLTRLDRNFQQAFGNMVCAYDSLESKYPEMSWGIGLNQQAWAVFQRTDNVAYLNSALAWAKKAVSLEPANAHFIDTYANLLYRLGNREEAIKWEKTAILFEPTDPAYQETLNKMKANERTWVESQTIEAKNYK